MQEQGLPLLPPRKWEGIDSSPAAKKIRLREIQETVFLAAKAGVEGKAALMTASKEKLMTFAGKDLLHHLHKKYGITAHHATKECLARLVLVLAEATAYNHTTGKK